MADLREQENLKSQLSKISTSLGGNLPLDDAIRDVLPQGTKVNSVQSHGMSAWSFTIKIEAIDREGQPVAYFSKFVAGEFGKHQIEGEYRAMKDFYKLAPGFVARPIAWGELKSIVPASYFLLMEFRDFVEGLPNPAKLGERLAEMHKRSESPTGMFGFGIQTLDGARLQSVAWDPSWTSFFSKLLAEAYRQDIETNGVWPELEVVFERVQSRLIPRLIGALEADDNSVKPCLIHGDLWEGNIGTDAHTGDPIIFDCAAYYAHNEMEMGMWRAERHGLRDKVYRRDYMRNFKPSEPGEEWDDRNRLYSTKTNFMFSACYAGSGSRQLAFDDFVYLIQKYVPWKDGFKEWNQIRGLVKREYSF